jgi:subtilisin family serine protease
MEALGTDKSLETSDWLGWLDSFSRFRDQMLPHPIDPNDHDRVRVTVIDTRIDRSHPFIKSKGWPSKKDLFYDLAQVEGRDRGEPIDEDGHGTFIAGILLQVAPEIELSIVRIGSMRQSIKEDLHISEKIGEVSAQVLWLSQIVQCGSYRSARRQSSIQSICGTLKSSPCRWAARNCPQSFAMR